MIVADDDAKTCAVLRVRFCSRQLNLSTASDPEDGVVAGLKSVNHENSRFRDDTVLFVINILETRKAWTIF